MALGRLAIAIGVSSSLLIGCVGDNDDDAAFPGILVTPTRDLNTTEHEESATFQVVFNAGPAPTSNVTIAIVSNDLSEGTVSPAQLVFTADNYDQPQTVTVTGVDDNEIDGHTTYEVILESTVSDDGVWDGIDPADVTLRNFDDEGAMISAISSNPFTTEDGLTATVTIALALEPLADVTVALSISDTTEASVSTASVTFTTENWATPQDVVVTGVDDDDADGMVSYSLVTAPAVSDDLSYSGFDASDPQLFNFDNDTIGIIAVLLDSVDTTSENGMPGTVEVLVQLQTRPEAGAIVPVTLASQDVTEGTIASGTVTFDDSNWNTSQGVVVTAQDDTVQDGAVWYAITVQSGSSTDLDYNNFAGPTVMVRNLDDDTVDISVDATGTLTTTEGGGSDSFDVRLATQPSDDVTIMLASSLPTEGMLDNDVFVFTPTDWFIPQTVTVTGVDDMVVDFNQPYFIFGVMVTSNDPGYDGFAFPSVNFINNDDDQVGITVNAPVELTTTEQGGTDSFTLVLNTQPAQDVTIAVAASDTTEGSPSQASVTFGMADWDNPRIITVTGINDSIADGEQAYLIDLAVTDGEAAYLALTIDSIPAINSDDDTVGATVSPRSLIISETEPLNPNGGMQLCPKNLADGQTFPQCSSFRVRLNTQPTAVVTFPVTNSDPIQMSVSRTTLQFSPADWATNQSVTVCGVDDGIDDSLATAMVMIGLGVSSDVGYSGYNPPDVGVTIVENCDKPL